MRFFCWMTLALLRAMFARQAGQRAAYVKTPLAIKQIPGQTQEDVIIASSSSALLMTEIQEAMKHTQRGIIALPFNPAHLVPRVELVGGRQTSEETVTRMYDFFKACGKVPVTIKRRSLGIRPIDCGLPSGGKRLLWG